MARVVIPYAPRAQFLEYHRRQQRWAVIVAHRRAGKTVACINDAIKRAICENKERGRYAYIAPFYSQAKQVAWEYLKFFAAPLLKEEPRESELSVKLLTGQTVRLYGGDNPNTLRGIYLDGVVMDEPADMKPSLWPEVIRPALTDRQGWATFIGTPKGKNSFWELWDRARTSPDWFRLMLKASETKILPQEELDAARQMMTADQYAQEFECSFEAAIQGAIYGVWMREALEQGRIKEVDYDPKLPVHTAWDLGFDDSTAIWFWQITYGEIRLIDYYESSQKDTYHYCEQIRGYKLLRDARDLPVKDKDGNLQWTREPIAGLEHRHEYQLGRHWVPHDAANELMAAGGRSIVNQMWEAGIKGSIIPATSQQNSIAAARLTLPRCWFDETRCAQGIEALRQYQFEFDEDKKTFKSKPRHDWASHGSDAFEIIAQVWRTPESEKPKEQPRFLHQMTADEVFWPKQKDPFKRERL